MSWIDEVPPNAARGPLAEVYRRISPAGRVANILSVQSLHPAGLRDHLALYRTLMFGPSPLSRSEREAIAVEVSRTNECHYWIEHHGAALRLVERDSELVDAVIRGHHAVLPPQLRTLLEYAGKLTRSPAAVTRADVDALRVAGYTDEAVLHAVEVTAYFAFVNRLADGLGVELEQ